MFDAKPCPFLALRNSTYGFFVVNVARISTYAFWGPNSWSSQLVRTPASCASLVVPLLYLCSTFHVADFGSTLNIRLWSRYCINFTLSAGHIFSEEVQVAFEQCEHSERMKFFLVLLLLCIPSPSWELEINCKALFEIFSMIRSWTRK